MYMQKLEMSIKKLPLFGQQSYTRFQAQYAILLS